MKVYRIISLAGKRDRIKQEGSVEIPLVASPYRAYYVFTKEASCLYGAGTKWCTTSQDPDEGDVEFFPNLVYFIHRTKTIRSDPRYYKLAIEIQNIWSGSPTVYRWDAWDLAMSKEEFLALIGLQSFDNIIKFVRSYSTMERSTGIMEDQSGQQDFAGLLGIFEPEHASEHPAHV